MNLEWSAEDLAFQAEVRAFFSENLTDRARAAGELMTSVYPDHDRSLEWQKVLAEKGWAAPAWPVEFGGTPWTALQHYIFNLERVKAGAPGVSPMGILMVAQVIAKFGTDAQKEFFLPRILSGEHFWCQGYSEPGSGSDLASLRMTAVADGDDFICNGTKIWTTHAHESNWIFCLVRTSNEDRPQKGISFILIPMDLPGIQVTPILMTSGEWIQNQVFFDNVRVPKENIVGEVGKGWTVAKFLLEFERGGNAYSPELKIRLEETAKHAAAQSLGDGSTLASDPAFKARLDQARIKVDVLEMLELRLMSAPTDDGTVGTLASMMKILGTELSQHITELTLEAAGIQGLAFQPHATLPGGPVPIFEPPADGYVSGDAWQAVAPLRYLNDRAGSIFAGSNEIQRNIIAKANLGL